MSLGGGSSESGTPAGLRWRQMQHCGFPIRVLPVLADQHASQAGTKHRDKGETAETTFLKLTDQRSGVTQFSIRRNNWNLQIAGKLVM